MNIIQSAIAIFRGNRAEVHARTKTGYGEGWAENMACGIPAPADGRWVFLTPHHIQLGLLQGVTCLKCRAAVGKR